MQAGTRPDWTSTEVLTVQGYGSGFTASVFHRFAPWTKSIDLISWCGQSFPQNCSLGIAHCHTTSLPNPPHALDSQPGMSGHILLIS